MNSLGICRICEQFPPIQGGLSSAMLHLSIAQYKQGHKIVIITKKCENDKEYDSNLPFKVIRISSNKTYEFGWKAYNAYKRLPFQPDIVHTHGPSAFLYILRRDKDDAPIVHTIHSVRRFQYSLYKRYLELKDSHMKNSFSFWKPSILKELLLEYLITKRADHLCLVAGYFKDKLIKYYKINPNKITVILNGTNFDKYNCKSDFGKIKKDGPIILFVGRFNWHKRPEILVLAHSILIKKNPKAQLILVGDGEKYHEIKMLTKRLKIDNNVLLTGWVEPKQICYYYYIADCLCLPSIIEGLPKVVLEAMSMKIPVVASDCLAHRELLRNGEYGFLVNSEDPEVWSKAICKAISNDSEVQLKVKKAYELINSNYRWNHVAMRVQSAYEKVLNYYGKFKINQ